MSKRWVRVLKGSINHCAAYPLLKSLSREATAVTRQVSEVNAMLREVAVVSLIIEGRLNRN